MFIILKIILWKKIKTHKSESSQYLGSVFLVLSCVTFFQLPNDEERNTSVSENVPHIISDVSEV